MQRLVPQPWVPWAPAGAVVLLGDSGPPSDCEPVWVGSWASLSPGWGVGGAGARGLFLLVQVGVWIDVGSRYESERNNGAGYFVEHLAFKVSPAPARGLALSLPGSRLPVRAAARAASGRPSGKSLL